MLTNPGDALRGQSRSPNLSYIGILSSCAIVILSLRRAVFLIFNVKKWRDLEIQVRGHYSIDCVLVFYRNIVPKVHHFWDIRLQKCCDLETRFLVRQGHWKCHHAIDRINFLLIFYSNYGSISCHFWDIQCQKISWPRNRGQRSLKVIESGIIRQIVYHFLLVFFSNFVPKMHCFWDIRLVSIQWPWNQVRVTQGHQKVIPFNPAPMTSY